MTWIVWRQQRTLFITLAVGLVLGVAGVLALRAMMSADFTEAGLGGCLHDLAQSAGACGDPNGEVQITWNSRMHNAQLLMLALPALVGVFIGAPLYAREFEQGTHALAFTQSVSRARWMATKFLVTAVPALAAVLVMQLAVGSWIEAAGAIGPLQNGRFTPPIFDNSGVSPTAYTLFAFTFGTFAGALLRRTLLAMTLTLGAFVVVRSVVYSFRESLRATKRVVSDDPFAKSAPDGAWELNGGFLNAKGEVITNRLEISGKCIGNDPTQVDQHAIEKCFRDNGVVKSFRDVIPVDALGSLHMAEAWIFLALSVLFVAGTVWAVRRQT
ncbi:ABC transporter permease [Actinoplanes philippinensis]|uniref:ABC transporter permease n=1 Tax=Actinoplanes philippinensis TaxID=35752 RepID=UPI0033C0FE63